MIPLLVLLWIACFWIACGALQVGLMMGYWKGRFPKFYQQDYRGDLKQLVIMGFTGPIALCAALLFLRGKTKYGLAYRRYSKEDKLALVEKKLDKK